MGSSFCLSGLRGSRIGTDIRNQSERGAASLFLFEKGQSEIRKEMHQGCVSGLAAGIGQRKQLGLIIRPVRRENGCLFAGKDPRTASRRRRDIVFLCLYREYIRGCGRADHIFLSGEICSVFFRLGKEGIFLFSAEKSARAAVSGTAADGRGEEKRCRKGQKGGELAPEEGKTGEIHEE